MPSKLIVALVLLLATLAADASAQARFRIYEPRSRSAEELAPLVAPMLGPDGTAVADAHGGSLILEGDPAAIADALAALESLDAPLHQYRIESETRSRESLEGAFAGVAAQVDGGGLRILRIAAGANRADRTRRLGTSLVVLEGHTAEIWTGTTMPTRFGRDVALVPVRSGVRVRPRALGSGEIELEITPVLAERGRGNEIRELGSSTQIRVKPGESVAIAGITDASDERGAGFPPSAHAESGGSDSAIIVRVTPFESVPASPESQP
jgi:type II secretory pathway component GspD/PulD (secretin)